MSYKGHGRIALRKFATPERLELITGWGKSRAAHQSGDVRGRIEALLSAMGAPMLPVYSRYSAE